MLYEFSYYNGVTKIHKIGCSDLEREAKRSNEKSRNSWIIEAETVEEAKKKDNAESGIESYFEVMPCLK